MIILLLLTILFATIAVTIAAGLAVLVVYLWSKWITALRALQVLDNGYQSLAIENSYLRNLLTGRNGARFEAKETEPLFVPNRSNTLH